MKILLLPIGKIKSRQMQDIASDYIERLSHYLPFEICVCKNDNEAISKLKTGDFFVVLDQQGKQLTSVELAGFIAKHQNQAIKKMVLFIGGPDGAGPEVRKRANILLGLSRMTFPHELAQIILLEQLYRACTILKGEAYNR